MALLLLCYECFRIIILDKLSKLSRFNNYPLYEEAYSVMLHTTERYLTTTAYRGDIEDYASVIAALRNLTIIIKTKEEVLRGSSQGIGDV